MVKKRDYQGTPVKIKETLQRLAIRQKREDNPDAVRALEALPKSSISAEQLKRLPDFLTPAMITCVFEEENTILWLGTNEGLWRVNEKEEEPLDRVMHFRATAYMLDNNVVAINGDGDNGVHVLTKTSVAHIAMKVMSAKEKAIFLSDINEKHVQRRGMLSGARWNEKTNTWHGTVDDNDGLWTSIVAMGDICRYAVLRDDPAATKQEVARAKKIATRWAEAVLLLAYIPSRKGKVAAFIRYNQPGVNRASKEFLLEGKERKIDMPEKGPTGYISSDIGPLHPEDWATEGMPEIVFRNIEGFIARSYTVNDPENDPTPYADAIFFRKKFNEEGKLVSIRIPSTSPKGDDIPPLLSIDSSMDIPERLRKLYTDEVNPKTGKHWGDDDIIYRCDTSNDELVGHYAVWHLAYDILGKDDPELAQIIKTIAARHAKHITDNGHCHTDAGGQPTSWARMSREYYINKKSYGFGDGPLGTMILMQLYKVAHHVTGDPQWQKEYHKLALEEPYRYADLAGEHFGRYKIMAKAEIGEDSSEEEVFKGVVKIMNYNDIRMAFIAYYTLTQLETDPVLFEKFKKGADSWWELEKYARCVEWSMLYQLINNEKEQVDGFGRPCLDMLKWQLNHYPVSPREHLIDNTSRPDLREEDGYMWFKNKSIPYSLAMDEKSDGGSQFFHAKQGRTTRNLSISFNMIAPYWLARYHKLIEETGQDANIPLEELMRVIDQD